MGLVSTLVHLALVLQYGYGLIHYLFRLDPPKEFLDFMKTKDVIGGPFKYLTFWDMLIQFTYFTLALVNDVIGSNTTVIKQQTKLQRYRDAAFSTVVFACGSFVTISFWGIYLIDRNLIFPPMLDSWFPSWLNHNIHTTPLVGVLVELYVNPHNFPKRRTGISVVTCFYLLYLLWICYIAYVSGHWVYPILAHFSMVGRVIFVALMSAVAGLNYLVGDMLNKRIWGSQLQQKKTN